jgi:hypothetical protein
MANVKLEEHKGKWWFVYQRWDKLKKKKLPKHYYHCTCKNGSFHGSMDVRIDSNVNWKDHVCFQPIHPLLARQLYNPRREFGEVDDEDDFAIGEDTVDLLVSKLQEKWIEFQNHVDLSYHAATSDEFYNLATSLIQAGQKYPMVPATTLFKVVSRETFKELRKKVAEKKRRKTITELTGLSVSLSFDSSTVGHKQILLSYLCHPTLKDPTFYCLASAPKSQAEYASCTAVIISRLGRAGISVGSVCVDGLRA